MGPKFNSNQLHFSSVHQSVEMVKRHLLLLFILALLVSTVTSERNESLAQNCDKDFYYIEFPSCKLAWTPVNFVGGSLEIPENAVTSPTKVKVKGDSPFIYYSHSKSSVLYDSAIKSVKSVELTTNCMVEVETNKPSCTVQKVLTDREDSVDLANNLFVLTNPSNCTVSFKQLNSTGLPTLQSKYILPCGTPTPADDNQLEVEIDGLNYFLVSDIEESILKMSRFTVAQTSSRLSLPTLRSLEYPKNLTNSDASPRRMTTHYSFTNLREVNVSLDQKLPERWNVDKENILIDFSNRPYNYLRQNFKDITMENMISCFVSEGSCNFTDEGPPVSKIVEEEVASCENIEVILRKTILEETVNFESSIKVEVPGWNSEETYKAFAYLYNGTLNFTLNTENQVESVYVHITGTMKIYDESYKVDQKRSAVHIRDHPFCVSSSGPSAELSLITISLVASLRFFLDI